MCSTVCTLLGLLPTLHLLWSPSFPQLVRAMAVSSLSFFLFSFQVHEKSILLFVLPVLCLPLLPEEEPSWLLPWILQVCSFR